MSAPGVLLVLLAMLLASDAAEAEGAGIIDFFKDAVLGDSKQQALFMGVKTEVRQHAAQELQAMITESRRDASAAAWERIKELEMPPDGAISASNGNCYAGGCCGWGHRLLRQAQTFTHVHYVSNRTMIMEWGPCPNAKGKQGSGKSRNKDFSSYMITDSIDIVNFEDTKCETQECKKCGAGNVVNGAAWQDAVRQLPGFTENVDGASFAPFQYFARRLLTQLKPELKQRLHDYIAEHFTAGGPVIAVHHRHGNGELDDFVNRQTGQPGGRLNKNNSRVIEWMSRSVHALQRAHGLDASDDAKVFFASDSPEMTRNFQQAMSAQKTSRSSSSSSSSSKEEEKEGGQSGKAQGGGNDIGGKAVSRVIVFDQKEKELNEGKGFIMPGWQGWGRSPGTSGEYKAEQCERETIRAFLDMALLGYSDLLVVSKKSSFTFFPALMMAVRDKPVCTFVGRRANKGPSSFTCYRPSTGITKGLAPAPRESTGLAPVARKR